MSGVERLSACAAAARLADGGLTAEAYARALLDRAAAGEWAKEFDAVLTLSAPGEAPRGLAETGPAIFNGLWTLLYMPCLTLPAGTGPNGLPVGVQLVGRRHGDERLLATGLWVEKALGERR